MLTLCKACGTPNTHRWSPLPPRCTACKRYLPFTMPRGVVYAVRSFWRPGLAFLVIGTLFLFSPYSSLKSLNRVELKPVPQPISASAYKNPPATHKPR